MPREGIGTRIVNAEAEDGIDEALTQLRGLVADLRNHPATHPIDDASEWGPVLERVITDLEAIQSKFYACEPVPDLVSD